MDHTAQLIVEYRYWILIPLSLIEGPIVAFVAGTLASLGYFNIYGLAAFFFIRDLAMDAVYYYSGYFGGSTRFAHRMLKKLKVTEDHLDSVRTLWERYPGRTMFVGKLSYGIAAAFIVVAGMVKMSVVRFFGWGAVVAVAQYGTLLVLGYFFGSAAGGSISKILGNIQYVLLGVAVLVSGYYIFSFYMRKKFLKEDI